MCDTSMFLMFSDASLLPSVGNYCNRTWDGWLCWADSLPGPVMQMCPNYFQDFDPAGKAYIHTVRDTCRHMRHDGTYILYMSYVFLFVFTIGWRWLFPDLLPWRIAETNFSVLFHVSLPFQLKEKKNNIFFLPEKVTKVCNPDGQWFHHPESNRSWTNYTQCQAYTKDKLKVKHNVMESLCVRHVEHTWL